MLPLWGLRGSAAAISLRNWMSATSSPSCLLQTVGCTAAGKGKPRARGQPLRSGQHGKAAGVRKVRLHAICLCLPALKAIKLIVPVCGMTCNVLVLLLCCCGSLDCMC